MGILSWIVFGIIAGFLAKWIMPGSDPGGIIVTMLLGIAGALIGGTIAAVIGFGGMIGFDFRSLLIAVGGAMILLFGYRRVAQRTIAPPRNV